ncbi:hypothetical protein DHW03_05230 [Pedobacter yonginense]|uniref:Glycosyltransferase 61 catalytic domain-containing protein n=1 Tax=Pedobacter yonginense TaxID=651869 RepID=A0A317ET26_9SPHI|nr:glycosyltransferase family 61 protein [Pedobacter yonginense]PWS29227.1 hypothetical protein DHW03_05230 [Pedobacter yonginense]
MPYLKKIAKVLGFGAVYAHLKDLRIKLKGYNVLDAEQTFTFLKPFLIKIALGKEYALPNVMDCSDHLKYIFKDLKISTDHLYVWNYTNPKVKAYLSKFGSVIIGNKVMLTHRDHSGFYKDVYDNDNRETIAVATVIAPFSHNQDEYGYYGYYDYLFFVAVKIARIVQALPQIDRSTTYVSYALFGGSYETEYLELFGLMPEKLMDSQKYKLISPQVLMANGTSWHPNLEDIQTMKNLIKKNHQIEKTEAKRVYISRAGRRKIINEAELITLLKKFNFEIVEDKKRSVKEQISIYSNASFVIGPHGASFANIIWCSPHAHLFELFSSNYVPDYFAYLANLMQMDYSAYYEGTPDVNVSFRDGSIENIYVSIPKLEVCLNNIFKT